jgi:signal transduction histidine kinase
MTTFRGSMKSLKEIPTKYPAVISGYIIYSYLFVAMIRFFILAKRSPPTFYEVIEIFDALPFLWVLAVTLVKVIQIRTKLHESEILRNLKEQELQVKQTQLSTMQEVVLGMQHQINNPLAVISLTLHKVRRTLSLSKEMEINIDSIEIESKRIAQALKDFRASEEYNVEHVGNVIGSMAVTENPTTVTVNSEE